MKIAIVFHSPSGTTKQLAHAVAQGAAQPGIAVIQAEIVGADIVEGRFRNDALLQSLSSADAVLFGSPTYMGGVTAQFKAFADATGELWEEQRWADKIAAGFTVGGNISGDQQCTLQYLQVFANQHGMLWAGIDIPGGYSAALGLVYVTRHSPTGFQRSRQRRTENTAARVGHTWTPPPNPH